tara:strand:- start:868 stop:2127 length:1260 start_codon:yes stop_codon:yes gene_type:complete
VVGVTTKLKKGSVKMNEKVNNEMNMAAKLLGMSLEDVQTKWSSIVSDNSLDLNVENELKLGLTLFRQWFTGMKAVKESGKENTGGGLVKTGFGIILGIEDARDYEAYSRDQLVAEYMRDRNAAFNAGKFAYADGNAGDYTISQILNGELKERKWTKELPDSKMEVDGRTIIPIDERKVLPWGGENPQFGYPRPASNWRRNIHFVGEVEGGTPQYWMISAKNDTARDWNVKANEYLFIDLIWDSEKNAAYPVKDTLANVVYNSQVETPRDTSTMPPMRNLVADMLRPKVTGLVNLENYHNTVQSLPAKERIVVTDGNVTNMNMNPNKTGNRTLFISDLNADFDYEAGGYSSTPCWVPPHIDIDFGIGSHVMILGRTSQSRNQETGELRQCSINVFGVIVLDKRGNPVNVQDSGEQYSDWL